VRAAKHRPRTQSAEELLPGTRLRTTLSEQHLTSIVQMDSEEKNVEDSGPRPLRLAASIDSATFSRRWRNIELTTKSPNYHLPKLHRRRGGIRKSTDKAIINPRRNQTCTPSFVPTSLPQNQAVDLSEIKEVTDEIRVSYRVAFVVLIVVLLLLPSLYYSGQIIDTFENLYFFTTKK